jgi:RNA polymerase II-associated factor 1
MGLLCWYAARSRSLHSKLDLIVRVRYSNPLPPPPAPPKLLTIPTDPARYAKREFLDALAADAPLPMIVDAEMGLPLDLSRWESLWDDDADDSGALSDHNNRLCNSL